MAGMRRNAHGQRVYRHFAGEALPEMEGVFGVLPFPLELEGQSFELGAAVLQPLVVSGALTTHTQMFTIKYAVRFST